MTPRRPIATPPATSYQRGGSLLLAVLRKLAGRTAPPSTDAAPQPSAQSLPAPGQRSGEGAASVAPYLDQGRSTRPGPLE